MQIREYENKLTRFDFLFEYIDDYREYSRKHEEYLNLLTTSSLSEEHKELFNFYKNNSIKGGLND